MFNALAAANRLKQEYGLEEKQADGIAMIIQEAIEGDLVTKVDLKLALEHLDKKMIQLELKLIAAMVAVAALAVTLVEAI